MHEALRAVDARLPGRRARAREPGGARPALAGSGQVHSVDDRHIRPVGRNLGQRLVHKAAREHAIVQAGQAEEAVEGTPEEAVEGAPVHKPSNPSW